MMRGGKQRSFGRDTARGVIVALVAGALLFAGMLGCGALVLSDMTGGAGDAHEPPTTEDLVAFERSAPADSYWLGRAFDGQRVSFVEDVEELDEPSIGYGPANCSIDVCTAPVAIGLSRRREFLQPARREPSGGWRECWRRLGAAWVLGCFDGDANVTVLTGRVALLISNGDGTSPHRAARALVRVRDGASITRATPPQRLTCRELLAGGTLAFARSVPVELRPLEPCRR